MSVAGMADETETDEWNVNEKILQEMKDNYRQVRHKDHKSPGGPRITISDREYQLLVGGSVVRTSVFRRRTFPVLRSTCS